MKVDVKFRIIYKSELFIIELKHKDSNVYIIHPMCGGPHAYSQLTTIVLP